DAILREDAGSQERRHQAQDTLVPDPSSHPVQQGPVVDLVERNRDTLPISRGFRLGSRSSGRATPSKDACCRS
ncbi:MAG: hypothetical protein ACP5VP_12045, partial [Candidatus Limnocylindrales bacterium]